MIAPLDLLQIFLRECTDYDPQNAYEQHQRRQAPEGESPQTEGAARETLPVFATQILVSLGGRRSSTMSSKPSLHEQSEAAS